jgi:hypothetical protein
VRKVLGDEAVFREAALGVFESYNEAQMASARTADTGAKVVRASPAVVACLDYWC